MARFSETYHVILDVPGKGVKRERVELLLRRHEYPGRKGDKAEAEVSWRYPGCRVLKVYCE